VQQRFMRSSGFLVALMLLVSALPVTAQGVDSPVDRASGSDGEEILTVRAVSGDYESVGAVSDTPDLDIISPDPDDPWSFFGSVSAIRAFADGTFVVADGQNATLVFFDTDGTFAGSGGGQGETPGRFRTVTSIPMVAGDTMWIWDEPQTRVTVMTRDGWVAGTTTILSNTRFPEMHVLPDRSLLGVARARAMGGGILSAGDRIAQRDTVQFSVIDAGGQVSDPLVSLPGEEWLQVQYAANDDFAMSLTAQLPLGRDLAYAVLPDGIIGGPNDRFELSRWDFEGNLLRSTRFPEMEEVLTPERVRSLRDIWVEDAENVEERVEHIDMVFEPELAPEFLPAFRRVLADTEGRVWIEQNDPWNPDSPRWWVFDDDEGVLVGYVDFPSEFEVHEIGADFILGVHRDFTGLPHVRRYAMELDLP